MFDEATTATQIADVPKERSEGAKVYFCKNCQSVLRPKVINGEFVYMCSQCRQPETIDDKRVYVDILKRTSAGFSSKRSLSEDPTLPRQEIYCTQCGEMTTHVLFIQSKTAGEETMSQMKECRNCHLQTEMVYPDDE